MSKALENRLFLLKDYSIFALATSLMVMISVAVFAYFLYQNNYKANSRKLFREAKEIEIIVSESFDYTNQINGHIGRQIAQHGEKDLKFILNLLREAGKIQNKNTELFSWTSFDWVDPSNRQIVNSRLGIRPDAPDMSIRQYTKTSPLNPWALQVSFPVMGNPSKTWVIPAGTGIADESGRYIGTVAVGFDINEFTSKIKQRLNDNVSFVVLDDEFRIVLQSVDNTLGRDSDFYKSIFDAHSFRESSGVFSSEVSVGDIKYSHYKKMPNYPYVVLTGFNKSFIKQEFSSLIFPRILEFVCITFFFLVILYLFKSKIAVLLLEERRLKDSLNRANLAKTALIRATSHDLKNYIFTICGLTKMILDTKSKAQIEKNHDLHLVETISTQSQELMYFVEDLLDTNQNETGEFALGRLENCDVKDLINRMILLNKNLANTHQVLLEANIEEDMPHLRCDIRRLKQILTNLITNSVKYSLADSKVEISAKYLKKEHQIYIEVADQGVGMTADEIEMALSGQGEDIDKSMLDKQIDSHGIGIQIVKRLVKLHGGKMKISSVKNEGTKVGLYFHITKADVRKERKKILSGNKTILLVEDNPVNIKITSMILESAGYVMKSVENGKEALEILDKEHFDLILMDGEMPVMNGYKAATEIRKGEVFKNFKGYKTIPIISLMASSDQSKIEKAKNSGMNGYMSKGTSKKEILEIIESYLA